MEQELQEKIEGRGKGDLEVAGSGGGDRECLLPESEKNYFKK